MIEMMLGNVRSIWQRFMYRDSIVLEAVRQKKLLGDVEDWGAEFSKLEEDDVFATLIQVSLNNLQLGNIAKNRH